MDLHSFESISYALSWTQISFNHLIFNLTAMLLSSSLLILPKKKEKKKVLKYKSIFAVHNQTQHSYTHIFNTDMKTKMSLQVIC